MKDRQSIFDINGVKLQEGDHVKLARDIHSGSITIRKGETVRVLYRINLVDGEVVIKKYACMYVVMARDLEKIDSWYKFLTSKDPLAESLKDSGVFLISALLVVAISFVLKNYAGWIGR